MTITPTAPAPTPTTVARPPVVTLCGSTRFKADFERVNRSLTLTGHVVLAPGVFGHTDGIELSASSKQALDALHLRKIDLADEVIVVNVGGYIGDSTRREIAYAEQTGKQVTYLHPTETPHGDQTDMPALATPTPTTRALVAETLAEHHAVTIALGGGLYVWACLCGAPGKAGRDLGASSHEAAYSRALHHTSQAVLDALARAGAL